MNHPRINYSKTELSFEDDTTTILNWVLGRSVNIQKLAKEMRAWLEFFEDGE